MQQSTVTLIVALVGIIGTLGGVFIGQRMSQTWQREQWIRDKRNEEFRELLMALADSLRVEMTMYAGAVMGADQQRLLVDTHSNTMRTIRSRIFVADLVERCQIELRWSQAIDAHQKSLDVVPLARTFAMIRGEIVTEAIKKTQKLADVRKDR